MNYQEQLAALEAKKQAKNLSAEQLKNWREILAGTANATSHSGKSEDILRTINGTPTNYRLVKKPDGELVTVMNGTIFQPWI